MSLAKEKVRIHATVKKDTLEKLDRLGTEKGYRKAKGARPFYGRALDTLLRSEGHA